MSSTSSSPIIAPKPIDRPLRRIVVGTDFSEAATGALRFAIDLASMNQAEVVIVNAIDPMITTLDVPVQTIIDDVRTGLEQAAAAVLKRNVKASTRQEFGKPWWVINETASKVEADLVIVASHGHAAGHSRLAEGLARLLGSTADRVVRSCRAPVLVVPANHAGSPAQWKLAVVGVDFSQESALAAATAAQVLTAIGRSSATKPVLILFHTVALTIDLGGMGAANGPAALSQPTAEHWDQAEATAKARLQSWASALRNDRLSIECETFRGYAPDGILHAAHRRKADFIAVGTHGLGAFNRMLLGSVAQRVLHHADCPVLTVRHPDRRE